MLRDDKTLSASLWLEGISFELLHLGITHGIDFEGEIDAPLECDEGGPPRWQAPFVTKERARGGPFICCTLD